MDAVPDMNPGRYRQLRSHVHLDGRSMGHCIPVSCWYMVYVKIAQ